MLIKVFREFIPTSLEKIKSYFFGLFVCQPTLTLASRTEASNAEQESLDGLLFYDYTTYAVATSTVYLFNKIYKTIAISSMFQGTQLSIFISTVLCKTQKLITHPTKENTGWMQALFLFLDFSFTCRCLRLQTNVKKWNHGAELRSQPCCRRINVCVAPRMWIT